MSGFDQSSIAVSMPTAVGADAALGGPYKIKPSEAFSGALMTVSGLTGETISVETSPDGYWGAPASPTFYRTDWQGTQLLYSTARTNLWVQSTSLTTAPNTVSTMVVAPIVTTAPDGTTAGVFSVTPDVSNSFHALYQSITHTAAPWSLAVYVKPNGYNYCYLGISGGSVIGVNLLTGATFGAVSSTTATVTVRSDGWVKIVVTGNGTASAELPSIRPYPTQTALASFAGDAVSGVLVWHPMNCLASELGAYIPTTTAPVTVTDYTISNGVITLAEAPVTGATLSYDNSVLPSPYYIFATGDGVRTQFAYDGVWGTLSANSGKGNGIWQIDLRGAQAYRLVKSAGSETATVNMTLKRDALQYKNTAGTWSVT